ncbi:MAG TPA: hypothetical protein VK691_01590 [Solirubrobacteraceae bacterium]|nr:hypothetical protein [Solirubrobacteraceae bacterium]
MISPQASFDTLQLLDTVGASTNGVTLGELQVLDYLGCLLSVYDGARARDWGFRFSVTETGAPFAKDIAEAVGWLGRTGWIEQDDRVFRLTQGGCVELEFQRSLAPNDRRLRYLDASASATLSMPLPSLSNALSKEPGLNRALGFMRHKMLLDETSLELVSDQFEALSEALKRPRDDDEDLTVPTVVWLAYLADEYGSAESQAA